MALLYTLQGRYGEARRHLEAAVRIHQALGQNLSEYRNRVFLAGVLEALGETGAAREERRAINDILRRGYISPAWSYHAFRLFYSAGELNLAREVLAGAEADTLARGAEDRGSIPAMRGWIRLAEGSRNEALAAVQLAAETADWVPFVEGVCRVAMEIGEVQVALDACRELSGPDSGTGWEAQEPSILALYWLGELYESKGETARATEHFARFLARWERGDPLLRFRNPGGGWGTPLEDARSRLARLGGATAALRPLDTGREPTTPPFPSSQRILMSLGIPSPFGRLISQGVEAGIPGGSDRFLVGMFLVKRRAERLEEPFEIPKKVEEMPASNYWKTRWLVEAGIFSGRRSSGCVEISDG